jgi:SAM-dependent methyltransferase
MQAELYEKYREAERTHWWFVARRAIFEELLDEQTGPTPDGRVLDVGTGTGAALEYLTRYGPATGLDMDPEVVDWARAEHGLDVRCATVPPLPFDDAEFSLVTALDVLEHVDDDRGLASELHRVLRPGGVALVTVPAFNSLWGLQDEVAMHKRRYRLPELLSVCRSAGFSVTRASYFNTFLFAPIALLRLAERALPRKPQRSSDFELGGSGRANSALASIFGSERRLLRRMDLPFGVSAFALLRKAG